MQSSFWRVPRFKQLECMSVVASQHSFPPHWHQTYVIEVVEQGRNEFWCNGKIYSAEPGDIIVVHPGEIHTGYPTGSDVLTYRSLYPSEELMVELCRDLPRFQTRVVRDRMLASMLEDAHRILEKSKSSMAGESLMVVALSELIGRYADQSQGTIDSLALSVSNSRMRCAVKFLSDHCCENISLAELSSICGLSEYHLIRTFKKLTGLAPYEYVIASRVEQSRKLLSKGMPIAEAAARAGFYDQSHLNRHFKRILGITPGKYAGSIPSNATAAAL